MEEEEIIFMGQMPLLILAEVVAGVLLRQSILILEEAPLG
jgi:hypothetical protein